MALYSSSGVLVKDSQEFLRCFMDHLHEELKQPVIMGDDDAADGNVDANNSNENRVMKCAARHCIAVDCDASEPSDTDYETCDSGLSSESNSVVADVSPQPGEQNDSVPQQSSREDSTTPGSVHAHLDWLIE